MRDFFVLYLFIIICNSCELIAVSMHDKNNTNKKWALLIVIDGAEDFNPTAIRMFKQFVNLNQKLNCSVALVWRATQENANFYCKKNAHLSYIKTMPAHSSAELIQESLQWFIQANPECYYAVLMAGHGYGVARTTTSMLDYQSLCRGLKKACENINVKIDVLCLDSCMMAVLELLSMLKESTHYCVASQACEPLAGINYTVLFDCLNNNCMPQELGKIIVQDYCRTMQKNPLRPYTLSLIDVSKISRAYEILLQVKELFAVHPNQHFLQTGINTACSWAMVSRSMPVYSDLLTFCTTLSALLKSNANYMLEAILQELIESLEQVIVYACASEGMQAHGLSFYTTSFSRLG